MLLICAATEFELAACPEWSGVETRRVVTGVGGPATFHFLPAAFSASTPALLLNLGIAGAYPDTGIAIGDIVLADGELWADVGMELPGSPGFLSIAETDFGRDFYAAPFPTVLPIGFPREAPADAGFRVHVARGATVNTCTGTRTVGERRARQTGAVFETMEGAAAAQIGAARRIPVCEVRAISNIAADRDMRPENIRRALENLRHYLVTTDPLSAVSFSSGQWSVVSGQ